MCGLTGFCDFTGLAQDAENVCKNMASTLVHRGPDDSDIWLDHDAGVALGHRRLSIQDLSVHGHQPMLSGSGRYVVAFNGEIYNFLALKKELEKSGHVFRGHSDTEVLLAAIETWGVNHTLERCTGMFAFALWDRNDRTLILARDRMGEKPLYYGWQGKTFLFSSELKAMRVHPEWKGDIDRNALTLYMRNNYIPAPWSIHVGIHKLLPGSVVRVPTTTRINELPSPIHYWDIRKIAEQGESNPLQISDDEAVSELNQLLRKSIRQQMIADVPLGAFLSGGYDSSTVAALMQAESNRQIKTFSIGFHEEAFNEAQHAKKVASHLGTEHTELYVSPEQAMDVIPRLPQLYDEPFADSSQIPTFLVSEMTQQHVTVSLSGDGGDELFAGYERYPVTNAIWQKVASTPYPLRNLAGRIIKSISPELLNHSLNWLGPYLEKYGGQGLIGDKLHKGADLLKLTSFDELYINLLSQWRHPTELVIHAHEPRSLLTESSWTSNLNNKTHRMQYMDQISYLPDDILVKVDRAAMGVSLETRVPFLDHHIVEFSWQLPINMKMRNGEGKWIVRKMLDQYIPREIMERPKMGFGVPISHWLRRPLRDWAESLLNERRLRDEGFLDPEVVRVKWEQHLNGSRNWEYLLWDVLTFEAWLEATEH
jgi:asparagine synthase (glutamine-hydrolysing)